jgi:AraC family transcriptional regulator, arabinose operon regulatory protein
MKEDILHFSLTDVDAPFNIQLAGFSWCDGSYVIRRKKSAVYVFEYIVKGRGYLKTPNGEFFPSAGDAYVVHANTRHEYGSSADEPWEKIWFNVAGPLVREMINCFRLNSIWHVPDCNLEELFRDGLDELRKNPDDAHDRAAVIILRIVQALSKHHLIRRMVSHEGEKLKTMLDRNVLNNPSIRDMAKHIGRSESQTIRIFKRDWGVTPYRYLLNQRIELAKLYLTGSAKSIKETAYELGFVDEFYFSDIFKKKTGLAPSFYRNKY